jgi:hypothetical protein
MILSAEWLGHFGIQEGDKRKRPEWLGNKHVRHFAIFAEIVAQVVRRDVLRAPADEYFARDLRGATLFSWLNEGTKSVRFRPELN